MSELENKGSFLDMLNENIKSIEKMTKSLSKANAMLEKKAKRLNESQKLTQKPWEIIRNKPEDD